MATARIRTPKEPFSAAWNLQGANYVNFRSWRCGPDLGPEALDGVPNCQECTSADRAQANFQSLEEASLWPDQEDDDDPEWQPDGQSQSDEEPLEYDSTSAAESSDDESSTAPLDGDGSENGQSQDGDHDSMARECHLSDLPFRPHRLPHGTWYNGRIYYRGDHSHPHVSYGPPDFWRHQVSSEHVASPSCRNPHGINGSVLIVEQMNNCRNIRVLLPKDPQWKPEASDQYIEASSLFYLTGEGNGSNCSAGGLAHPWMPFYPARHGLYEITTRWIYLEDGCNPYESLHPLAAHSYCFDIYAKASYRRLGRVDLDNVWHWREMLGYPNDYKMGDRAPKRRPEIERGRARWDLPWRHVPGDEWIVANPVEVPKVDQAIESCRKCEPAKDRGQLSNARLLQLPDELIAHTLSFLDSTDLDRVADTCWILREHAGRLFKAHITTHMPWLWEILEGSHYPVTPDRPVTWDPLYPPGVVQHPFPCDLPSEREENALWASILADDPEMEDAANAVRAHNRSRREEIRKIYHESQEWQDQRSCVETWIRRHPHGVTNPDAPRDWDWTRVWRLFKPATTLLPGIRNRARIWEDCEQILDCVAFAHSIGETENKLEALRQKIATPQAWSANGSVER